MINGLRFKVLASLLVLSQLEDPQFFEIVVKICNIAIVQRDQLFAVEAIGEDIVMGPVAKFQFMDRVSLYNKRILATALLRSSDKIMKKEAFQWEDFKVVSFDALITPYDFPAGWGMARVNDSPEDRIVRVVAPLTDEEFSALMKEID